MVAVAAVGAGGDYAFFFGKAGEEDVEEAAEGEAEEGGEEGAGELEWVLDVFIRLFELYSKFVWGLAGKQRAGFE